MQPVLLRALEPEDVDLLYEWENDPEVWRVSCQTSLFSRSDLRRYIASSHADIAQIGQKRFVIVRTEDNLSVGTIDLFDYDAIHRRAGVGVLIYDAAHRQQGFAAAAVELVKEYAFGVLSLHQLYVSVDSGNDPSIALFRKSGFVECGLRREWFRRNGLWIDTVEMQCLTPYCSSEE